MSILRVTGDLNYNNWELKDFFVDPREIDLQIGFKNMTYEGKFIAFNNLRFGFFLREAEKLIQQSTYPPAGMALLSTDQDFVEQIRLNIQPDRSYKLHIWAENAGQFYELFVDLNIPKYEQPFESWIWEDNEWIPPTPYPDDGEIYVWEEDKLQWVLYDHGLTGTLPE